MPSYCYKKRTDIIMGEIDELVIDPIALKIYSAKDHFHLNPVHFFVSSKDSLIELIQNIWSVCCLIIIIGNDLNFIIG